MINSHTLYSIGLYTASFGVLLYVIRTGTVLFSRPQNMPKMKAYEFTIFLFGFLLNILSYFFEK